MNKNTLSCLLIGAGLSFTTLADEGQWQPHQIAQMQSEFDRVGIELPAKQVADLNSYPMNAIVGLGYCSASFVSPKGLVVTNHHCAHGAIQNNATAEKNLIESGFLAKTMAEELSAGPQERLYITEQVTDVTAEVIGKLGKLTGKKRYDAIQNNRKRLISDCETDANYRCSVDSYHHGMEYFLTKKLMIKDVRLVYAPPEAVGNFGGDIDNYEFPRHTGDFTFLRAYVGKDGKPASYSKDNVPFKPKSWLKVSAAGVKTGDGIILAGFPGRTSRYRLASEIEFAGDWQYQAQVDMYNLSLDTIAKATANRPKDEVAYASRVKSINNRMKKRLGLMDGFKVTDIHGIKLEKEKALLKWLAADAKRKDMAKAYKDLARLVDEKHANTRRDFYYDYAQSSSLLGVAQWLYRLALESEKPDAERKLGYQERNRPMIEARLKRMARGFTAHTDRHLWSAYLAEYLKQPKETRVMVFDEALNLPEQATAAQLFEQLAGHYQKTGLADTDTRVGWMKKSVQDFRNSDDPFIQLAVKLYKTNLKYEEEGEELTGQLMSARPQQMAAIIAYNESLGKPVYPDANSTLRITYGSVGGYPAADGVYKTPFTSVRGMIAKDTGEAPFNVPENIKQAYAAKKNFGSYYRKLLNQPVSGPFESIPVNFLSSADTTGGNSGSAVMNGKGELVGLNFDSTYESITKDWYFNARITRAIHVDIRYVLWLMEAVDGADNLIKEMTVIR